MDSAGFQARASEEGRAAQDLAARVVKGCGFAIVHRNLVRADLGVTINLVTRSKTGEEWFFDVSGAFQSDRAGLIRTDTVWKTLGRCSVLAANNVGPIVLLTTNLPKPGGVGDRALRSLKTSTFYDVIEMTSTKDRARLRNYAQGWLPRSPLPGFWNLASIFGQDALDDGGFDASVVLPLEKAGDPLKDLLPGTVVTGLPHRLKVIIPSQERTGRRIPDDVLDHTVHDVQQLVAEFGGGFTSQPATGYWVDPVGGIAHENVTVLETYSSKPLTRGLLTALRELFSKQLNQDAMALVIGDQMLHFQT